MNQMKSVQLAFVCRHWRSVITTLPHLWSTLRVGPWTEKEQVATWLQRAYPKKVIIDIKRNGQRKSNTPQFAALQDALASTSQWHELTISSFPPDNLASQLGFQTADPMNLLKVLHVAAGCAQSLYFTHLLDLVPTEAPLSELKLYSAFTGTYFLQPNWFLALQNLTVLIVNGRGIHEPFGLLPAFTQLQIFEADHLLLPSYEANANLPLLHTLQRLSLRASSVQWMAGRDFPCLEECAILLPRHWVVLQQHGVQLPSCRKLTYYGHPMTTVQYLHAPQMKVLGLGSNDCKEQRVYQYLHHLFTLDGTISKLTTLHLTLKCSEQVLAMALKYLGPLQELVLSTARPSLSWQTFLESLAATPSTTNSIGSTEWRALDKWNKWDQWCSSQTWCANVLPHLKYLGIQCPKGFSPSECLGNCALFRLIAWTRAQLSPPLQHLEIWEGRGTTEDLVVDYTSSMYLGKHLRPSNDHCDSIIVKGMVTKCLVIDYSDPPLFHQLHLTALFRRLQVLIIYKEYEGEILILPDLEQIKRLAIWHGIIPTYSLNIELPLVHTLQQLHMRHSTFSWMLGRTFKALEECTLYSLQRLSEGISGHEELQVDLPGCKKLTWDASFPYFSSPNVQSLQWEQLKRDYPFFGAALKSLPRLLLESSHLKDLQISNPHDFGLYSLIPVIFCDSLEQGAWKNIRSVKVEVHCYPGEVRERFYDKMVARQHHYEKGWKEFLVSKDGYYVNLSALM